MKQWLWINTPKFVPEINQRFQALAHLLKSIWTWITNAGVFNIRDYGAHPSALPAINDAAIIAADAAASVLGGTVYYPPGSYRISASVQPSSNTLHLGAHRSASKLVLEDSVAVGTANLKFNAVTKATVRNLGFTKETDGSPAQGKGGHVSASTDCLVEDCYIGSGGRWGVFFNGGNVRCGVVGTLIEGDEGNGIELNSSTYCYIERNQIVMSAGSNIGIECYHTTGFAQTGNRVTGNVVRTPDGIGIGAFGETGLLIADNTIVDAGSHGIYVTLSETDPAVLGGNNIVAHNVITNIGRVVAGTVGIVANTSTLIEGNSILSSRYQGITAGTDCIIEGNTIHETATAAIYMAFASNCSILGNTIQDCIDNVGGRNIEFFDSDDVTVIGNVISDRRAAPVSAVGIYIDAASANVVVSGNPISITGTEVSDNSATTLIVAQPGVTSDYALVGAPPAAHVLATSTALGAEHTTSGLTAGHVLTALSATTAAFQPAAGGVSDGDKGDITVSGGGTVWTIDPNAVTASEIIYVGGPGMSATDVEAAIDELATEKVDLAGQLGGSTASPDVRGLRTTTGPTLLTIGAIVDGEMLKRVGATIVSAAPGAGSTNITAVTLDFGSVPIKVKRFTVVDAGVLATSQIMVTPGSGVPSGQPWNATDEWEMDECDMAATPDPAGGSYYVNVASRDVGLRERGALRGERSINALIG